MFDKLKWKWNWNKKAILKGTAIAAVPLLGVSAFLGYWFLQPTETVNQTPADEQPGNGLEPGEEISGFEIQDAYWLTNQQIYFDYSYTENPEYIDNVVIKYGYDGHYESDTLSTEEEDSYLIFNDIPPEEDIYIDVEITYTNEWKEWDNTTVYWEDNPGYYQPKPDNPGNWTPGTPINPSYPEDPFGIKDPITITPIDPISTTELYTTTTSQGEFNQQAVETVLLNNFDEMIDWYEPGISDDAEYDLYYELVDPYTLNIMVVESIDGQVLNETKYTYSIV